MLEEMVGVRVTREFRNQIQQCALDLEIGESALVRLAIREFIRKPRITTERIHAPRNHAVIGKSKVKNEQQK